MQIRNLLVSGMFILLLGSFVTPAQAQFHGDFEGGIKIMTGKTQWNQLCGFQVLGVSPNGDAFSLAIRPLNHHDLSFPATTLISFASENSLQGQNERGDQVIVVLTNPQNPFQGAMEYHVRWLHDGHGHTESCFNLKLVQ